MKVLLEFGLSGHCARDCRLGWFRDGSDGAILLLRSLLRAGYVERPESVVVWRHWFGVVVLSGQRSHQTNPDGVKGSSMAHFHQAERLPLLRFHWQ